MALIAWSLCLSRGRSSSLYFSDTKLHLRVRNISHVHVAYSSTSVLSGTYSAGIHGNKSWIRMYVARHQKEQELGTDRTGSGRRRSGLVVELRNSSATAN